MIALSHISLINTKIVLCSVWRTVWSVIILSSSESQMTYVLSFYTSKIISDCPNCFGRVQIVLVGSKSFWSGSNRLFWTSFYNLELSKMFWTRPKLIGPVQNNWYSTKMIWTVQNHFGSIEGQHYEGQLEPKWADGRVGRDRGAISFQIFDHDRSNSLFLRWPFIYKYCPPRPLLIFGHSAGPDLRNQIPSNK